MNDYARQYARGLRVKYSRLVHPDLSEPFRRGLNRDLDGVNLGQTRTPPASSVHFADFLDDHSDPRGEVVRSDVLTPVGSDFWYTYRHDGERTVDLPDGSVRVVRLRPTYGGHDRRFAVQAMFHLPSHDGSEGGDRRWYYEKAFDSPDEFARQVSGYPDEYRAKLSEVMG
jgi:hypothetical protein